MRHPPIPCLPVLASLFLLVSSPLRAGDDNFSLKTADSAAPVQVKEPIRKLLAPQAIQVLDGKGELYCEVWFRKSLPVKATAEQVKNGLTYRELDETTVLGAIRYAQTGHDYREQKFKPGVYTLRLGFQPQDGDHMGTAPHPEFCLVVPAEDDVKPDLMEPKALQSASTKAAGSGHPGVLLLFPNNKPEAVTKLANQGMGHWVIKHTLEVEANGKPAPLGISLTVVGHSVGG